VPYPKELRHAVEKTVELWEAFTKLPVEVKAALPYHGSAAGVGYELKTGNGVSADRKENFDVSVGGEMWLAANRAYIENKIAHNFIEHAASLVPLITPFVFDFAREVEERFGFAGFADEVHDSARTFFVRFIHYFAGSRAGEEIAGAHTDRSGFTLHLFESAGGLQFFGYDQQWRDLSVNAGETVVIPAMQMQLRSAGRFRALCHRVVATNESERAGRLSAVCFVELSRTPVYDKEKHGRLQEQDVGFNYTMPLQEFTQLFSPRA
jgi:hypothetical protein